MILIRINTLIKNNFIPIVLNIYLYMVNIFIKVINFLYRLKIYVNYKTVVKRLNKMEKIAYIYYPCLF